MRVKFQTEMDEAGRVTIPEKIMSELHFKPGIKLIIKEEKGNVILKPENEESLLMEKDGVLVLHAELTEDVFDIVDKVRQERIDSVIKDSFK